MNQNKKIYTIDLLKVILPLILLIVWFLIPVTFKVQEYILPTPKSIFLQGTDFIFGSYKISPYSGTFLSHSIESLVRVLLGFLIALLVGLPLGILTGYFSKVHRLFDPLINLIRMVPGIGWLPIAMIWFGVGNATTVFLIALAAFFPIYLNSAQGVRQIPLKIIQAGRMLGAKGRVLFMTIIIPASMPSIVGGMRLGLGICWAYLVLGELTGVSKGLGAVMMDSRMLGNIDIVILCMICIAFWGKITDMVLMWTVKKLGLYREELKNE